MDSELLLLGGVVVVIGVAIIVFGPRLVQGAWHSIVRVPPWNKRGAKAFLPVVSGIAWAQKAASVAFGIYGVAFGILLILTGFGLVDGFGILDRIETWLGH